MQTTEKLTERAIKALKPQGKPYKAADGAGLHIYITPADTRPVVLAIEAEGHHEFARRALAQIGRVLSHAVALGHAERDVAADRGDVLAPVQSEKYAALTKPAEIGELMRAIHSYTGDPTPATACASCRWYSRAPASCAMPAGTSSTSMYRSRCGAYPANA